MPTAYLGMTVRERPDLGRVPARLSYPAALPDAVSLTIDGKEWTVGVELLTDAACRGLMAGWFDVVVVPEGDLLVITLTGHGGRATLVTPAAPIAGFLEQIPGPSDGWLTDDAISALLDQEETR